MITERLIVHWCILPFLPSSFSLALSVFSLLPCPLPGTLSSFGVVLSFVHRLSRLSYAHHSHLRLVSATTEARPPPWRTTVRSSTPLPRLQLPRPFEPSRHVTLLSEVEARFHRRLSASTSQPLPRVTISAYCPNRNGRGFACSQVPNRM